MTEPSPSVGSVDHPDAGYAYVPGISPYSAGVRALAGHKIRRVQLRSPLPWRDGFAIIDEVLAAADRPSQALCSIELRCPEPHSFGGFGSFNDDYRSALADRNILFGDGTNPVARTNVAPAKPPAETELYAFAFTQDAGASDVGSDGRPSFVVSGAGDLHDQADLRPEAIVGGDGSWLDTGAERAAAVVAEIESRMSGLGVGWSDTDTVVAYSVEDVGLVIRSVNDRLGPAAARGVLWHLARPPIAGLLYEMDARGGLTETAY
ncbi:MAG: 2-amino-5-chloromuconate deaminase CnbZ [Acidimicrobiales bacterium]